MHHEITKCRICGSSDLIPILNLGKQNLTGVFPTKKDEKITSGPLALVKCAGDKAGNSCGLLQLRHSYDLHEMYGLNYGYRSGLNRSMIDHLHNIVNKICTLVDLKPEDLIIDIGSNDSTLLQGYPKKGYTLVGIDPTGRKFKDYYPDQIHLIADFFSARSIKDRFGSRKAKVISSIAMFYDLESPIDFMQQIHDVLADDGVWVFEQSYMPAMLEMNAYDTVCHEHLEHYGLTQIKWMTDRVGFKIIDVELNNVNGGSFALVVAKSNAPYREAGSLVEAILGKEKGKGLHTLRPYEEFKKRVFQHRDEFIGFLQKTKSEKQSVLGYGASTKGNVILQFCHITEQDIPFIAEVNKDKFGCYTPGTLIPIISEAEARAMKPDYFIVLPWHFKENIIAREVEYLSSGGTLFFPLPELEAVKKQ
ncbi:MAG: methyltransferase [Deltaproteobacteria bacterium RBG_16_58_17]|nr:MAG: methyltransferase [Deltaproteobacteria bacterium RBG_16_58_17]OHE19095.1 MAG: methyltransferase [Syntrophobacterales bacterium GWC2_56_13]OHE20435.1 MAG: methyltransferase [Syntrophobacterales bacterium GWF2_56_9]